MMFRPNTDTIDSMIKFNREKLIEKIGIGDCELSVNKNERAVLKVHVTEKHLDKHNPKYIAQWITVEYGNVWYSVTLELVKDGIVIPR